ncbi:hypothetical protein AB0K48_54970, partial [Nonomuraea sp. NPDC055795]
NYISVGIAAQQRALAAMPTRSAVEAFSVSGFIVDPNNEIQFTMVTAGSVGRNVKEVLRVLDALQSDELCPCNWNKGERGLDAKALLGA